MSFDVHLKEVTKRPNNLGHQDWKKSTEEASGGSTCVYKALC